MTSQNITELRKAGNLDEAYQLAKEALIQEPLDIWIHRAMAWVCYDYMKIAIEKNVTQEILSMLTQVSELKLTSDDTMMGNSLSWLLGKWLQNNSIKLSENEKETILKEIVELYAKIPKSTPNDGYSYYVKMLHKAIKDKPYYCEIMANIGFDFFEENDYKPFTTKEGRQIMSFVEQYHIAFAAGLEDMILSARKNNLPKEKINSFAQEFIELLSTLIKEHPEYVYPLYYKCKLLLAINKSEEAIESLRPFIKKKANDFWVWQTLGDATLSTDKDLALSCYCKALTFRAKPAMLIGVREDLANILVKKEMYQEAKTEIEAIINVRNENGWRIPNELKNICNSDWYESTTANKNNFSFYKKNTTLCEQYLYSVEPKSLMLITYVNTKNGFANFLLQGDKSGFFRYTDVCKNIKAGEIYDAIFTKYSEDAPSQVVFCQKSKTPILESKFFVEVEGKIKIVSEKGFGFVENIFVSADIVRNEKLANGMIIKAIAMRSYDRNKQKYGWALHSISSKK